MHPMIQKDPVDTQPDINDDGLVLRTERDHCGTVVLR